MAYDRNPVWLQFLQKKIPWLAVPNIGILFVTLQVIGFLLINYDSVWFQRLALFPDNVLAGEYWRLITFLALPLSFNPFWAIIVLWFVYFIFSSLESEWGSFKTTLYILCSLILTIASSLLLDIPVTSASDFQATVFLAAAVLFPNFEIRLFFVLPVKMKWLGWLTGIFLIYRFFFSPWSEKLYLLAIYGNFLLFFGPAVLDHFSQIRRQREFKKHFRR